jgi:hypothetical protein
MNCGGGGSIETSQHTVQVLRPTLCCALTQPLAELWPGGRRRKKTIDQRTQVESCSTRNDWQPPALNDARECLASQPAVVARRHLLVRPGNIDHVMWHQRAFFLGRLCIATESQETISPLNCSASRMPSAVFPLAVGPAITIMGISFTTAATIPA